MPSQYGDMLRHVMSTMIALNTVSDFLEMSYLEPDARHRIRSIVEKYLPKDKRVVN